MIKTIKEFLDFSLLKIFKLLFAGSIFIIYTLVIRIDILTKDRLDAEKENFRKEKLSIEERDKAKRFDIENYKEVLKARYKSEKTIDSLIIVINIKK